jgi:hypothetical protein
MPDSKSLSEKGARLFRRPAAAHGKLLNAPRIRGVLRLVEDDTAALRDFQTGSKVRSIISHLRVGDETLTVPRYGGALVGPDPLRQVFNDTAAEVPGTSSARRRNWSF